MGRLRAHRLYPSDLTNEEWKVVKPLIPVKTGRGKGRGRPRLLSMRAVLNALFYLERTGCQWDYLPRTYPNVNSVRYYYERLARRRHLGANQHGTPRACAQAGRQGA